MKAAVVSVVLEFWMNDSYTKEDAFKIVRAIFRKAKVKGLDYTIVSDASHVVSVPDVEQAEG